MDQLLDQVRDRLDGPIDFEGQQLAEQLTTVLLAVSGILALIVGYVTQNIYYTLYVGLGGTLLTFVVVVLPWPWFNQHPARWLPARSGISGISINMDAKS